MEIAMSDEEIKKALECCASEIGCMCSQCPLNRDEDCLITLPEFAFALINRQQAEIERLKSLCTAKDVIINEQEVDIERLNGNLFTISNACMQRRNEAIKEFAERLESKYTKVVSCNAGYVYRTIKEVEKEMVGGENA